MPRKPATQTPPVKRAAASKPAAKKSTTTKTAAKKTAAKKTPAKKAPTKKPATKKAAPGDKASKSARTRQRVMDAAAHVLSVKGYAGMRLSDVAEQAELQAPAIYYYFQSREDLIEEVVWSGIADMREHLTRALDAAPEDLDPLERILLAVDAHLRHELELSDYATAAIRNAGQLPDELRTRFEAESRKYFSMWRDLFNRAAQDGALRADLDPYLAQMLVMGALNWAAEWWTPRRGSIDTVVRTAQTIVRNGLAPQ
ncbi:MAG TPA: TetR/AcrR family transcriptional regulator [Nocardioides sp.]|nr:TetR/AcrR family transcriptional regulator [Nocardioides sp.]